MGGVRIIAIGAALVLSTLSAQAVELVETFDGPGLPEGWLTDGDTWQIDDGALRQSRAGLHHAYAFWPRSFADVTIEVRFMIHPGGDGVQAPGIIYRAVDEYTYYYVHFDRKNRQVVFVRSQFGNEWTDARRHGPFELREGEWHTARVEAEGSEHRVYLDGELLFTEEDDTITEGVIGLRTGQGDISFDDLRVSGEPGDPAPDFTVTRVEYVTVCEDAGGPGAYEAFPDVCLTRAGELLCVFYAGYGHVSFPTDELPNGGRVSMVRSSDLGRTWSAAEIVVDTPIDDRDPSITQLSNGDLLVTYMSYVKERAPTHEVFTVRSTDNGETWGEPQRVELPWNGAQGVSEPVTELADGTLLLPVYGYQRTEEGVRGPCAVLRSHDMGETWPEMTVLQPPGDDRLEEPTIEPLTDGRILMLIRPKMRWSQSTDGGVTWSRPEPMPFPGHAPYQLLTSRGVLVVGFRSPVTWSTSVAWSTDLGRTWQGPKIIDPVVGGYPSLVELPDGRVFMVYYTEGVGSDIRGVYLDVTRDGVELLPPE